jgi:acyl-CoA synthetase (NDP forming)
VIGFSGRVVPVNPKRSRVFGLDCIPTLRDLDAPVDLAYIAAPTGAISAVLKDAGAAGVRNAVVIAASFGESGAAGHQPQRSLVDQARRHGITLLGPNCPGFLNATDGVATYG